MSVVLVKAAIVRRQQYNSYSSEFRTRLVRVLAPLPADSIRVR